MIFPITDITALTEAHLQALITDQVAEGREIDYKVMLPSGRDQDKVEFLADLVSFANTLGGYLVFGMEEDQLLPIGLPGIAGVDWDREIGRLEGWAVSGIEPRIPRLTFRAVPLANGTHALVVYIPRSLVGPHRLKINDLHRFYGRTSRGKYPLDIQEVRALFAQAERTPELLRRYRAERLALIGGDEALAKLPDGPKAVLNIVPVAALADGLRLDPVDALAATIAAGRDWLAPLGTSGWNPSYNFDGFLATSSGAYLQIFRDGAIETVSASLVDKGVLPSVSWCEALIVQLRRALQFYAAMQVAPPFAVLLSLVAGRGLRFAAGGGIGALPLARDSLLFPAIPIDDAGAEPATLLRPAFDSLWQAFGLERCPHYDDEGKYRNGTIPDSQGGFERGQ